MQKHALVINELSVIRMPGFPRGMERMEALSSHVNIVSGPNASGKSSTARVINQLIWRNDTSSLQAEAALSVNGERWDIKLEGPLTLVQRNGQADELSGLPHADAGGRYTLSLHDLVKEDDSSLARQIARESIGGYDLEEARHSLGYGSTIRNKSASEYRDFAGADQRFREVRDRQQALKKIEESLILLYADKDKALKAAGLKDFYARLSGFLEARIRHDQAAETVKHYPAALERATGEEYQTIKDAENERNRILSDIEGAKREIKECMDTLHHLGFPDDGISDVVLNELEKRSDELAHLENEIKEANAWMLEYLTRAQEALDKTGYHPDASSWKGISVEDVELLDVLLLDAQQVIGKKALIDHEISSLQSEHDSLTGFSSEQLTKGIFLLSRWLHEERSKGGVALVWYFLLAASGLISSMLIWLVGWQGLAGLLLPLAVASMGYVKRPVSTSGTYRLDYEREGLELPAEWNIGEVVARIETLTKTLEESKRKEWLVRRIAVMADEQSKWQRQVGQIEQRHLGLLEKLKVIPGLPDKDLNNYSGLHWLLLHVREWHKNHAESNSFKAKAGELSGRAAKCIERINLLLAVVPGITVADAIGATTAHRALKDKETLRRNTLEKLKVLEGILSDKEVQQIKVIDRMHAVYRKLGVEEGDKETVRQLVGQLEQYRLAVSNLNKAEDRLAEMESILKDHSLYNDLKHEAESLSFDEADMQVRKFDGTFSQLEKIQEDITRIETNISHVSSGHDLESALSTREEAIKRLESMFVKNLSSMTGQMIIDQLKKESGEQNRPKVFKRAGELFGRITRGRYELRLDESGDAAFRAYDHVLNIGQELAELSTGTRIQLLIAVRLAFIETQESALRLPVLADELLANSDDARAKAIIDALIEISREGRQVFYFTAQTDEVAKWEAILKQHHDVPYKVITLSGAYNKEAAANPACDIHHAVGLLHEVPQPGSLSRLDYAGLLKVPSFDPLNESPGQLHLWYLIEDNMLLHRCLSMGIRFWGQLDTFFRNNGRVEGLEEKDLAVMHEKAVLLERFCNLYRRGRSRKVDVDVVLASGAVSGAFIQQVTDKLKELGGDPERLLIALRNREVPRFSEKNIESLEQYLVAEAYIDRQDRLEEEDLKIRLQAFVSGLSLNAGVAESFLKDVEAKWA